MYSTGKKFMQKDFSYPLTVADLPLAPQHYRLAADKDNLIYLAEVLQVPAVKKMQADIYLKRQHGTPLIELEGHIAATLVLESVVSLEKFDRDYDFDFRLLYDTEATFESQKEESWREDLPDVIVDGRIDLVDVMIEQTALRLDDYPRRDGEVFAFEAQFDDAAEVRHNPFDMLAKLKK